MTINVRLKKITPYRTPTKIYESCVPMCRTF